MAKKPPKVVLLFVLLILFGLVKDGLAETEVDGKPGGNTGGAADVNLDLGLPPMVHPESKGQPVPPPAPQKGGGKHPPNPVQQPEPPEVAGPGSEPDNPSNPNDQQPKLPAVPGPVNGPVQPPNPPELVPGQLPKNPVAPGKHPKSPDVPENPDVQPPPPSQPEEPLFPFDISHLKPGQCSERCHQMAANGTKQCENFCPLSAGDGEWKAWLEQIWMKKTHPKCPMEMKENVFSFIFCPPIEKGGNCGQSDEGIFVCYQSKLDPENKIVSEIFQVPNSQPGEVDTRCNAKEGKISENVDPGIFGKFKNSVKKMHGFRVATSGEGEFFVETSFSKRVFIYDMKDEKACLKLEMFPDGGNLFWSEAYEVNPINGKLTAIQSNLEIEGVEVDEVDENNEKKKKKLRKPEVEALANGMPLSAKCFLGPWLLGADIFFQYKNGPMYLQTMKKENNADSLDQCLPQMVAYSSSQIVPIQICRPPEVCEFGDSVWEVAKPGKYWNRVTIGENKINIEFLNGNNDQLDLAIAVPNPHQFVLKVEELSGASPKCWDGQDEKTCSKSPISFEFNFNNNNDPDCKIRYSSGPKFTCMNMNGTDNLNNVDDRKDYILGFTFNGIEVLQKNRNWTNLIMPQKCAVNNQPIQDFGQVLGFTNNKFVMHFTLMPFALPTFKDDGADRGESDENDCPRAGMPFSLGFYPNKTDNTDKLKYDLLLKKKSEKKEEEKPEKKEEDKEEEEK